MPQYKFIYFNVRARGEIARLLFAAAGKKYVDERISFADWGPDRKSGMVWGMVPVLERDGQQIGESLAIADHLATEFGLIGKTSWDAAVIRSLVIMLHLIKEASLPIFFLKDKPEQERQRKEFIEKKAKTTLQKLEDHMKKRAGQNWFVGSELTWADLTLYDTVEILCSMEPELMKPYTALQAVCKRVEAHPGVAKWLKDRPQENQKLSLDMPM